MFLWVFLLCLVPPSTATEVIFAQPGGSVTLPRVKWGATDKVYVNWYFVSESPTFLLISRNPQQPAPKAEKWQDRISLSPDFSLIISSVQDFGVFQCEQHELTYTDKKEYRLYRITMPSTMTLVAGDDLSLSCDLDEDGYNLARTRVECFKPDGTTSLMTSQSNRNTVIMKSISSTHSGSWRCSVHYSVFSKSHVSSASTALTVIDLAPSSPDHLYTSVSVPDFTVPCALSSSVPWSTLNHTGLRDGSWSFTPLNSTTTRTVLTLEVNPTPQWRAQKDPDPFLKERELNNHDFSVQIPKVSVEHRGTYTCSLRIKSKLLSSTATVEVLQINSSARGPTQEGGTVNLTCSLGRSLSPGLQLVWTPPRLSSKISMESPHPETLLLSPVRLQHAGNWKCTLKKNQTSLTTATVKVEIVKAPVDVWLVVSITCGVLVSVLLLVITVIIVYRNRQVMKRRRRRTRFCCCEKPQPKGFYKT